jgi:phage-related minor tail protein
MKIYNESKQQGISLTAEQIQQAAELINEKKKLSAEEANAAEASKKAAESQKQWNNQLTYAFKDAIMNSKNLGDALSNLANRVQDMLVNKALDSLIGGFLGGFAKGAAFSGGGVTAFASGGVVNSPTMFPMRGGVGLMGEAGAEAIMPLTRTSSGDLGVKAVGAGTVVNTSININVSGGTKEQNDDAGRKVSTAVKQAIDDTVISVILREKRPGGVLNAA